MRNFDQLDQHDWTQIQMAANGCINNTLAEWPHLQATLTKIGVEFLTTDTPHDMLKWVCEALYWQCRADQFAMKASEHRQAAADQEKYTQELFAENEKLRVENENLKTALALEHQYGSCRTTQEPGDPVE